LIVEVEGRRYELDWRAAAVLLVLRMVEWGALTLSDVELVATGHASAMRTIGRLVELGLVSEYNVRGTRVYELTELGAKVAEEVKRRAEAAGLWRLVEGRSGG